MGAPQQGYYTGQPMGAPQQGYNAGQPMGAPQQGYNAGQPMGAPQQGYHAGHTTTIGTAMYHNQPLHFKWPTDEFIENLKNVLVNK